MMQIAIKESQRPSFARGGHAKAALAIHNQTAAAQRWLDAEDATQILLAELRSHGSFEIACKRSEIGLARVKRWRKAHPAFNNQVRLALAFASSTAVDYQAWLRETVEGVTP